MRYHFAPIRKVRIQNNDDIKCWQGCGPQKLSFITGGNAKWFGQSFWKTAWHFLFFFKNFYWSIVDLQRLCQFLLYSKVNQLYIYIYPLFFRFFSHIGHQTVLSRVPCAMQQVLISYLFYIQQCVYVNPNLPIYPSLPPPLVTISLFSIPVTLPLFCK